jgi:hypothetical protein
MGGWKLYILLIAGKRWNGEYNISVGTEHWQFIQNLQNYKKLIPRKWSRSTVEKYSVYIIKIVYSSNI